MRQGEVIDMNIIIAIILMLMFTSGIVEIVTLASGAKAVQEYCQQKYRAGALRTSPLFGEWACGTYYCSPKYYDGKAFHSEECQQTIVGR
jgi:hypothetical protein